MKAKLPGVAAIACWTVIVGCSSAPTITAGPPAATTATTAAPSAPVSASTTTAGPAAAAIVASTTVPLTPDLAALTKAARAHGYSPRSHNGTIVFCKTDQQIGTRFQTTSCISQADVANVVSRAQSERDDIQALQRKSKLQPMGN